MNAENFDELT